MSDTSRKEASATLRIASREISAAQITATIGVKASEAHDKGEVLSSKSPTPRMREESLWLLESSVPEDASIEAHLNELIDFASSKAKELDQLRGTCDIELLCSFTTFNGQGGFVIGHLLAEKLAALKLDCIFDLYGLSSM